MENTPGYIKTRLTKAGEGTRYLPRALRLVWSVAPGWTSAWLAFLVVQGVLPTVTVFLTRAVVNAGVAAIRSGGAWTYVRPTLILAAAMGLVYLVQQLLSEAATFIRTAQSLRLRDHIAEMIQQKSVEVDLAFYDSSDFYDHLHRARFDSGYRPVQIVEDAGLLLQNGITVIAMMVVVVRFSVLLPLAILITTLPALYVVVRAAMRSHEWQRRSTMEDRRSWYYDALLTERQSAMEMRLFATDCYFREAFSSTRRKLRAEQLQLARNDSVAESLASIASLVSLATAISWMTWRAIHGLISLGDLALFYQAFNQSLSLAGNLLGKIGHLYQNALFLGNLFAFLDLEPQIRSPREPRPLPVVLERGIEFSDVSFRYPGSERAALQHFNLHIAPAEIVALVGPNGTGKTTLAKLLCRFYDPESGTIAFDGTSIREFALPELRRAISVLFQEPVHYNDTVAANILLGDTALMQRESVESMARAAELSGFDEVVARLPDAMRTRLGGRFLDGTELSMGEWQRLALARAIARESQVLVLDEPTSAMDPWAELAWAQGLRNVAGGRATLLITHRFNTAMFADRICVMAEGKIVESGSHQELLEKNGMYAQGWAAQNTISG